MQLLPEHFRALVNKTIKKYMVVLVFCFGLLTDRKQKAHVWQFSFTKKVALLVLYYTNIDFFVIFLVDHFFAI